jgi:hypothetical protein
MEIAAVHQRNFDRRSPKRLRQVQSAKASADDHHAMW